MLLDLNAPMPWPKKRLRKLGVAIAAGVSAPAGCPSYDEVVEWHSRLAEAVGVAVARDWPSCPLADMDVSARAKTHDTLAQKLNRMGSSMGLDRIQDIAGVRLDADITLTGQTNLASEICGFFGQPTGAVKDIRLEPERHAGYRAIHLHLAFPAGRVEVQIRTRAQSSWANAYEALGDAMGREIRYGEPVSSTVPPEAVALAERLRAYSFEVIALMERNIDRLAENIAYLERVEGHGEFVHVRESELAAQMRQTDERAKAALREVTRTLDSIRATLRK